MMELEIPDLLVDYRFVRKKPIEPKDCPRQEVGVRWLRELYRDNPRSFLAEWTKLEGEYLRANTRHQELLLEQAKREDREVAPVVSAPSEWDGKGACPVCKREPVDKGTVEAVERGRKWLEEHGG